jgi:hypothetical protein
MKPSESSNIDPALPANCHFELPVEDFHSEPPWIPIDAMIEHCEFVWKSMRHGIPTEAERLEQKVDVEFVL